MRSVRNIARQATRLARQSTALAAHRSGFFHTANLQIMDDNRIHLMMWDGAGTSGAPYSPEPGIAFMKAFEEMGVSITWEQAIAPMGVDKREHATRILQMPDVQKRWQKAHGPMTIEEAVSLIYDRFKPQLLELIRTSTMPIPGMSELFNGHYLPANIKHVLQSAYDEEDLNLFRVKLQHAGVKFHHAISTTQVMQPRPHPAVLDSVKAKFGILSHQAVVLDDSPAGVKAGRNGNYWVIGTAAYSTLMQFKSFKDAAKLSDEKLNARRKEVENKLYEAGAHFVVKGNYLDEIPNFIHEINSRLARGMKPSDTNENRQVFQCK